MHETVSANILRKGADEFAKTVLANWKKFGKLQGDEPSIRERTMAYIAAESLIAEALVFQVRKEMDGG